MGRTALAGAGLLFLLAGCAGAGAQGLPEDAVDYTQEIAMTLEVTGTARTVDLAVDVGGERTEATQRSVPLRRPDGTPMTLQVPLSSKVEMDVTVGPGGGDIRCRLLAGAEVVDEALAAGPYASATCEGWPPVPDDAGAAWPLEGEAQASADATARM